MMKTYLAVPFSEKDEAKSLGAQWDQDKKQWYASNNETHLIERWKINEGSVDLTGEDRLYGGNDLFVDLIPSSCWFTNVRYCVHPAEWDRLSQHIYERNNYICECCGARSQLEAHERWDYNHETQTQKLVRLVALCQQCHQTTHMGYARTQGRGEEAILHLKHVRNFTESEITNHIKEAYDLWRERNKFDWHLDLSLITSNGIKLAKTVHKDERRDIAIDTLQNPAKKIKK